MIVKYQIVIHVFLLWIYGVVSVSQLSRPAGFSTINKDLMSSDESPSYILSKLSDRELIRLLSDQPQKRDYDLNDILKVALESLPKSTHDNSNSNNQMKLDLQANDNPVFRLENKEMQSFSSNNNAVQKINNLLYKSHSQEALEGVGADDTEFMDDNKKEELFDKLVAQLKLLCCKKSRHNKITQENNNFLSFFNQDQLGTNAQEGFNSAEYMFLVLNDEIKGGEGDEVIPVDPNSLDKNSSVLLLGPIQSPLNDEQLKTAMNHITSELSKPQYVPILQHLSDGVLSNSRLKLIKNLISGPETRRYIKPHRCNYQAKLSNTYGGPRWLVCTGYLNLNGPSIYD